MKEANKTPQQILDELRQKTLELYHENFNDLLELCFSYCDLDCAPFNQDTPMEELPLLINEVEEDSAAEDVLKLLIEGEDIHSYRVQIVLQNRIITARDNAENDPDILYQQGELVACGEIFRVLGMEDEYQDANFWGTWFPLD